jgi:external thioesterase TEII
MNIQNAKPVIVSIHFAGGNCYSFQFLKPFMGEYKLVALELPGRGKRIGEPLIKDKRMAVEDLYAQLTGHKIEGDFILYGHSMGATLALLLCEKLQGSGIYPGSLVVTGACGPGVVEAKSTYLLKGEAFKDALRKLGGISEKILEEEELFEYFEPMIRSDFELLEVDDNEPALPLSIPIYAVMGSEEEAVEQIDNWKRFTTAKATREVWKGDHFFIHDYPDRLAELLKEQSEKMLSQGRSSSASVWSNE